MRTRCVILLIGALANAGACAQDDFSDRRMLVTIGSSDLAPTPEEQRANDRARAHELEREGVEAFTGGDLDRAALLFEEQRLLQPNSFHVHYNLACVRTQQGELPEGERMLAHALAFGFDDVRLLETDDALEPLRGGALYQDLIARWDEVLAARRAALVKRDRAWMRSAVVARTDEVRRFELLSSHDEQSTDEALGDIDRVAAFVEEHLFPEPSDDRTPWVTVVLPSQRDFAAWARQSLGQGAQHGFSSIGGAYDHDRKRLVAQDLGATLRHEFVHVLHWRDMQRRGQHHAVWVQEGLAALVEDYDLSAQDEFTPAHSWRTNSVGRLARAGRLPKIVDLAKLDQRKFSTSRPLARYAHARAVFEYVHEQGKLKAFYEAYAGGFDADPTGIAALESALGQPIGAIDKAFNKWVRGLEPAAETGRDLLVTLGVEIEEGTGDGVRVVKVSPIARKRTGLRLGSIITGIDGRPVRDMKELIRVLGGFRAGDVIVLHHRRGLKHGQTRVELVGK